MAGEVVRKLRGMFGSPCGNSIGRLALLMQVQTRNSQTTMKVHRPSPRYCCCVASIADHCLLKCSVEQGRYRPSKLAKCPSRVSLGCISPVLRHCATGGWPKGFRRSQNRSGFRGTALPLKGNTTGIAYWLLATLVSHQMRHVGTL